MARTTDSTVASKADGFLNLRVVAKDGTVYSFKTGIALHASRKLDAKVMKDTELFNRLLKSGAVTASVYIAGANDGEDPEFE